MSEIPEKWDLETEVLVIGTGGAGLTAAILAHDHGAGVTVVERSEKVGGTTAWSGGSVWVPCNHHMAEKGFSDTREAALKYCKALAKGRASDELIEAFVDVSPEMLKYMEKNTSVTFVTHKMPDYHPEIEGGAIGRGLGTGLFSINGLGDWLDKLRRSPQVGIPMTFEEVDRWGSVFMKPQNIPWDEIAKRMEDGLVGMGESLIGHLFKACLDRGIEPLLNTRGLELVIQGGRVVGLSGEQQGKKWYARAGKAVILACGGFEWNQELVESFLPGPVTQPNSPRVNEGDGLKMAISVGAQLGNMSETWGFPSLGIPGEEVDGHPWYRAMLLERSSPHCIIVNRQGKRFVNEAACYSDMFRPLWYVDENTLEHVNIPCWHIFDQQFHDKYPMANTIMPGDNIPPWIIQGDTLEELAQKAGIDPGGLKTTCARFNKTAGEGVDHDFNRGKSAYDRYWGDQDHGPNPSLGTIEKPPFYAWECHPGGVGTKGGPKTNTKGQVLHISGRPIPGLYAAGNVMSVVSGPSYWGAGATIGPAMTFGYICGKNAAIEEP